MRLFFALWPPPATAAALHAWAMAAQRATGGRVTRAETIHLTLSFLGEVQDDFIADLKNISLRAAHHSLPIEEASYWVHNRIVWVGPRETPRNLDLLASSLDLELKKKHFKTESKKFSAHITLIRKARMPDRLPQLPAVDWSVEEFVLVRSMLSGAGPSYEIVERFALR